MAGDQKTIMLAVGIGMVVLMLGFFWLIRSKKGVISPFLAVKGYLLGFFVLLIGVFITVLVQSSSITTSLLVPMIGAGILPLEGAFAITLGANIGTTVTALLASTTGTHDAVAIALVHLFFNLSGILLIYPFRPLRMIPIRLAEKLAEVSLDSKWFPVLYLVFLFFVLPGAIILLQRTLSGAP